MPANLQQNRFPLPLNQLCADIFTCQEPLVHRELFTGMIWDTIPDYADDWSNGAEGEFVSDLGSTTECQKFCQYDENCFQSVYDGKDCVLGANFFKLGYAQNATETQRWQSSWNRTRIAVWVSSHPCGKDKFAYEKISNSSLGNHSS